MKSLRYFLIIFSILFTGTLLAQNEKEHDKAGVEQYLKNTVLSIASDQKNLLALNITEENKELSNAIVLQKYAMKLFESSKEKEALICSSKARQLGVALLKKLKGDEYASHYDHFEKEEAQIAQIKMDASTIDEWLAMAKQ